MQVQCTKCGTRLNAKAEWIGKTIKCPKCKTSFVAEDMGTGAGRSAKGKGKGSAKRAAGGGMAISGSVIALIMGGVVLLAALGAAYFGPIKSFQTWNEKKEGAEADVRDVVQKGLQKYVEGMVVVDADDPKPKNVKSPQIHDLLFDYFVLESYSFPESVEFRGISSEGEFSGVYFFEGGRVEATCAIGANILQTGVAWDGGTTSGNTKGTGQIKVKGSVSNGVLGQVTVEGGKK
ncbi:MAG TPA: hypothetical protein PK402_02990 [Tepidisphaeraceae bacterium]|nr:hypothetical protein [Tepidisphaeraceae bacterium]